MTARLQPLYSRSFDVLCELGLLALSGSDALLHCQIGHSRNLLALGGDRLRKSLELTPEQWASANAFDDALESARQLALATSKWQAETMRQIETQAAMAHAIVTDALNHGLVTDDAGAGRHGSRSRKADHRLAA